MLPPQASPVSRLKSKHCLEALGLLGNGFKAYAKRNHLGCWLCNLFTQLNTLPLHPHPSPPPTHLTPAPKPYFSSTQKPSLFFFSTCSYRSEPQRRKGQSRNRGSVSALSAVAYTATLLVVVERVKVGGRASPTHSRLC
jgi:hypothetical protein